MAKHNFPIVTINYVKQPSCTARCLQTQVVYKLWFIALTLNNDSLKKMHRQWSWRQATASPHGRDEPNKIESETLTEEIKFWVER